MATVTPQPRDSSPPPKPARAAISYEEYIERHIAKTRQHVKWADIAGALMTLAGGTLVYLLAVALVDHWVLREGLGFWGRMTALVVLIGGGGAYVATSLLPLLLRRINPVYAAHAIEQTRPTLKNTLVNFLLLRGSHEGVSQQVYQAVQQQAAVRLSQMPLESAVDRTRLIRISIAVLAIVSICCLYTVLSPKNPLRTVRRVILPWADIAAPTRVTIEQVTPGDTSTFHDGAVQIQALVRGMRDGDPVTIYYSTADGQLVNQAVPMQLASDGYRHTATLPAGTGGLRQDVDYFVTAGDAQSKRFHIQVRPAPTIAVDRVEYVYPKYTGLEPYLSKHGDLKAIEGTRATLHAVSNQKIAAAWVDLDCKGTRNKRLEVNEREATARLPLKMASAGQTPEFTSYQIRFTNDEGHENPQPIRHSVEVVRDLPPEIKLVEPTQPQLEVPANGRVVWKVWARDVDFALSRVEVVAERVDRSGDLLIAQALLKEPHEGEFEGSFVFEPAKLKLKAGDSIRYWAEARDNRQPDDNRPAEPNRTETEKFRITIVEPTKQQPQENDLANNDRQQRPQDNAAQQPKPQEGNQPRQDKPQPEKPNDQQQPGEKQQQPGENQQGQPQEGQKPQEGQGGQKGTAQPKDGEGQRGENGQQGEKPEENATGEQERRIDPMTNPGDAFEKIKEHLEEQNKGQQNKDQQQLQPGKQPQQQTGEEKSPQQQNQQQPGDKPQPGQKPQQGDQPQPMQPGEKPQDMPGEGQQPQQGAGEKGQQPNQKPMPGQQGGSGQNQPDASQQPGGENSREGEGQQGAGSEKGQQSGTAQQKPNGGGQGGKPSNAEKPAAGQDPERPQDGQQGEKPMPGEKPQGDAAKSNDNATPQSPEATRDAQGKGAEVKGQGDPKQKQERPAGQKPDTEGGDRDNEKGEGGAGQKTDNKPSPTPQEKNQTRGEKKQRSPENQEAQGEQEQPKSPSGSPKQSDSQGGESGDRSGGGKSGGGQTASGVKGTGGPGQSTASDQGQSKAPGSGEGETGDKAGNKVQSDKPTGQSDPQGRKGDGSQQRAGGDKPGGEKSDQAQTPAGQPTSDQSTDKPQGAGKSENRGGGQPGGQASERPSGQTGDPTAGDAPPGQPQNAPAKPAGGEDPNLDYARKATDLALEHLKDQLAKDKPDQELLDKLKWSRDDLQKFVDHWERMKRQAAQPGAADAKKKLDESLRGLGLAPRGTQLDRNSAADDTQRNFRSSRNTAPPPEYAEQVKAYKQRLSKGQEK